QPERVAGSVFLAIRDDLEVIEPERGSVEPLAQDREQVASFDGMSMAVVDRGREPVLARRRGFDGLAGLAVLVQGQIPAFNGRLDRLALGVVADLEQLERALAGDRLAIERLSPDG